MRASADQMTTNLFKYHVWAFEKTWKCINKLTNEQFGAETGYSHGSIRNQLIHVISSTRRWIDRLQNQPARPHLEPEPFKTISSVKKEWRLFINDLQKFVTSQSNDSLNEIVEWEISVRNLHSKNSRSEILMHIFNHATDHRTQILSMISLFFHKNTIEHDLIFFLTQ